jgi:hypothetical protein
MRIGIITPAPPRSRHGNRVTALRWARLLKDLDHRVTIAENYSGQSFDLLIALHAKRSYSSIRRFHQAHPDRPLIVALTGTDLYRDLKNSEQAWRSLELATRIITLQPEALKELPEHLRRKTRVIYQSVQPVQISKLKAESSDHFTVCVIGHLRAVKDPFRAAMAARLLPASSRLRVIHIGRAMTGAMKERAQREMEINPRYQWLGELSQPQTLSLLAASDL